MSKKHVFAGLIGLSAIVGWNVFLIQRDNRMFDAYYRQQAVENLKHPPSSDITYSPKERFCQSQAKWHPDCDLE